MVYDFLNRHIHHSARQAVKHKTLQQAKLLPFYYNHSPVTLANISYFI